MVPATGGKDRGKDRARGQERGPEEGAAGNPFYNPEFTNSIKGPGGIEIRTAPADEIHNSAGVEVRSRHMGGCCGIGFFGGSPSMDSGGSIIGSGGIIGHEGEEIAPARAVVGAKNTLQ